MKSLLEIIFLNEQELICLRTVKWFQILKEPHYHMYFRVVVTGVVLPLCIGVIGVLNS